MRRLLRSWILATVFCGLLHGNAIADKPLKVLIYDHSEGKATAPANFQRFMTKKNGFDVRKVTPEEIRGAALEQCDVLIIPGGSGSKQSEKLEETGREKIKSFVKKGGGYVGVCAGSYLASSDYKWSLHLINAKVVDRAHWARGTGQVEIELNNDGQSLLDPKHKELDVYYGQGPLLAPGSSKELPAFEALATYKTEIAKNGAPEGVMPGTVAIARTTYGEGRVICYSPHPEKPNGPHYLISKGVQWVAKRKVTELPESTTADSAATDDAAGDSE